VATTAGVPLAVTYAVRPWYWSKPPTRGRSPRRMRTLRPDRLPVAGQPPDVVAVTRFDGAIPPAKSPPSTGVNLSAAIPPDKPAHDRKTASPAIKDLFVHTLIVGTSSPFDMCTTFRCRSRSRRARQDWQTGLLTPLRRRMMAGHLLHSIFFVVRRSRAGDGHISCSI